MNHGCAIVIGRILGRAGRFLWEGFNPRSLTGLQEGVAERRSQKNPWQEYNYLQQTNTAEYNTLLETLHSLKVSFLNFFSLNVLPLYSVSVKVKFDLCRRKEPETQAYWLRLAALWHVWTSRPISWRLTRCFCKSSSSFSFSTNLRFAVFLGHYEVSRMDHVYHV